MPVSFTERIADRFIAMIADGRLTYPMIENLGFWIAQYTAGSEMENRILTFCRSVIANIEEVHNRH